MSQLTLEELKKLKYQWYEEAVTSGKIDEIAKVCRVLGNPVSHNYGPKYSFERNGIVIYLDDYGNYMTVHYDGKLVCSTHPTERLFVRGVWTNIIQSFSSAVEEELKKRDALKEEDARKKLAQQLGLE
jgi:hypothetical protein